MRTLLTSHEKIPGARMPLGSAATKGTLGSGASAQGMETVYTTCIYAMIAVGYVRVSTFEQAQEGISLEAQREKLGLWANLHDRELVSVHEDAGVSGSSIEHRPGVRDALDEACQRRGALVVYSLSRLARSTRDTLLIADRLSKAGAELVSLSERIDTTSASGRMVFRLLAALCEFERDQVSERTQTAMQHLRRQGRRISRHAPFGWSLTPDGRHLVENQREQDAIALMRRLRAEGTSYAAIGGELSRQRILTKLGSDRWSPKVVRGILMREQAS